MTKKERGHLEMFLFTFLCFSVFPPIRVVRNVFIYLLLFLSLSLSDRLHMMRCARGKCVAKMFVDAFFFLLLPVFPSVDPYFYENNSKICELPVSLCGYKLHFQKPQESRCNEKRQKKPI